MSMSSGMPWMGSPIANLSLSNPLCNNDSCKAFYDAHQLSQKEISYSFQFKYGQFTTWFYLAWIGLFSIIFFVRRLSEEYSSRLGVLHRKCDQCIACWRFIAYRRSKGYLTSSLELPSIGMLLFLLLAVLYLSVLTFAARPYYRQHRGYGSPPIAVRTGLMADALTPLIIILAGKANIVTLLTGISHEKLNVIHRWVGWMTFALSVVHTVPFLVAPLRDGGYYALHKQFYKKGSFEYTGVPPLAILFGILTFSLPWIRHRVYEGFYHLHFWLAVTYTGLMFWHAGHEGDSWVYLWATLAAWLLSILARVFWYLQPLNIRQSPWAIGSPITSTALPDDMTRLNILAPDDFHWSPGQHIYVRLPEIATFDNHPFTIASIDRSVYDNQEYRKVYHESQEMHLLLRSHAGFTRRLHKHARSFPDSQQEAWVEGPYGGIQDKLERHYNAVILIAGGSGISACLPWLEHFTHLFRLGMNQNLNHVELIWSIRHVSAIDWISERLSQLDLPSLRPHITVKINITGEKSSQSAMTALDTGEKGKQLLGSEDSSTDDNSATLEEFPSIPYMRGRIDMSTLFEELPLSARSMVIGCGPEGFKADLSNAVATAQRRVLRGYIKELSLHTETFGW